MSDAILTLTKSELARKCGVSMRTVRRWCNVDFYDELVLMGYRKHQHIFTPRQTEFLIKNIIEFSERVFA